MRIAICTAALLLEFVTFGTPAAAQLIGETAETSTTASVPRGYVALGVRGAQPLGDFSQYIDFGFGFGGGIAHALDPQRVFSIRANVDVIIYGHETTRYDLNSSWGGRMDITTSNNILSMGVGPHVAVPTGPIRPYATGTVGFSYFSTNTSLTWYYTDEELDSWTDFSDAVLAWTAGGGVLIPLTRGPRPVMLDLSAIYYANGEAEYLREGSISRDDQGNTSFTPIRSETNLMVYTIGVSIGAW